MAAKKSDFPLEELVRAQKVREHLFGVKPRRTFTFQEYTEYHERIKLSEGFDIGNAPDGIDFQQMYLRPVWLRPLPGGLWTLEQVEDIAKLALDKYNEDNNLQKKYQFVRFLRANYTSSIRALEYYSTCSYVARGYAPPNAGYALEGGFGLS